MPSFDPASLVPLSRSGSLVRRVGTKGSELVRLAGAGARVPEAWILEADVFQRYVESELPRGHEPRAILRLSKSPEQLRRIARARERIEQGTLDPALEKALSAILAGVLPRAPLGLAVRLSATCDDATIARAAGLTGSILAVRTSEALQTAVKAMWARIFSARAMAYLQASGAREVAAAVVLQVMIPAEHTGRLFLGAPRGLSRPGDRRRLVAVTGGFGTPVADGSAPFDLLALDEAGHVLETLSAPRDHRLVFDETQLAAVAERSGPTLPEGVAEQLAALAILLEERLPDRFSAVFAESGGEVWVLGAHPRQGRGFPRGGDLDTVWSRAYVGDLLPGVVTPLTWSVAAPFAEKDLRRGFAALGCNVRKEARFIASVQGRMYLHVSELVRVASALPGIDPGILLDVTHAGPIPALDHSLEGASHRAFYARLPLTAARLVREQTSLGKWVKEVEGTMARARQVFGDLDLTILPDDALVPTLRDVTGLIERVGELHLTSAIAFVTSLLALTSAIGRGSRASAGHLAQTLAVGIPDLPTIQPVIALARLADAVRGDDPARVAVLAGCSRPEELPEGPGRRELSRFLADFGHRGVREAELSRPRFAEDPSVVASMVRACLGRASVDPAAQLVRARSLADHELALAEARLSRVEVAVVHLLLSRTRRTLHTRERLRDLLAAALTMLRQVVLEVDRRLIRVDPSLSPGSAFFCTLDELFAALRTGRPDLAHVVRLRRFEHAADVARPDPPLTFVGTPTAFPGLSGDGAVLKGVPGSPGIIKGRARLCRHGVPEGGEVLPGEILVCRTADVAISPYLLVAGGLVVEQGGPYASAMVVARELSVPAIGYVSGAMALVRTGSTLVLDGAAGTVGRL